MKHLERAHAKLSASGAERWMRCPGSVQLEEGFEDKQSDYTLEGTKAHELAEKLLNRYFHKKRYNLSKYEADMLEYVNNFVDYVIEIYNSLKVKYKLEPKILVEQRLDLSAYVPESFGTGDVVIIGEKELHIIDLKYGKGVVVDAIDNPQLRLYALGALEEFGWLYEIDTVTTHIVQPRLDAESKERLSVIELESWGETIVKPAALQAFDEDCNETTIGNWCRFCKAKAICKAQRDYHMQLAQQEFEDLEAAKELSSQEIAEVLKIGESLVDWYNAVKEYALGIALQGEEVPGFKVVEGRSSRKITDTDSLVERLHGEGYEDAVLFEKKLLSLTNLEKLVGKKQFNEMAQDLIVKPPGKPALVDIQDKREPMPLLDAVSEFEKL